MLSPTFPPSSRSFPHIAQYPTHWQHDLILPYEQLPTYGALRESGLETVLNYRGRPNVVGVFKGSGGGRSLIVNGHVDTVTIEPAADWTRDPFGGEINGDRLFGRGASDMKGGVMAALMALSFLRQAGGELKGDVIFESVVNEEHAGNGTLDLVRRGFRADGAIVLEPTHNRIAVSHTGGLYWQVTLPGVPRSPGARWEGGTLVGVSAIEKLPVVVSALLALEEEYNSRASADREAGPGSVLARHRESRRRALRDGHGRASGATRGRLFLPGRRRHPRRHAELPRLHCGARTLATRSCAITRPGSNSFTTTTRRTKAPISPSPGMRRRCCAPAAGMRQSGPAPSPATCDIS